MHTSKDFQKNVENSKRHHPTLYRRAFLIYLGNGMFRLAEESENVEILIYGNVNSELPQNIKQEIENVNDERIIIIWHCEPSRVRIINYINYHINT